MLLNYLTFRQAMPTILQEQLYLGKLCNGKSNYG